MPASSVVSAAPSASVSAAAASTLVGSNYSSAFSHGESSIAALRSRRERMLMNASSKEGAMPEGEDGGGGGGGSSNAMDVVGGQPFPSPSSLLPPVSSAGSSPSSHRGASNASLDCSRHRGSGRCKEDTAPTLSSSAASSQKQRLATLYQRLQAAEKNAESLFKGEMMIRRQSEGGGGVLGRGEQCRNGGGSGEKGGASSTSSSSPTATAVPTKSIFQEQFENNVQNKRKEWALKKDAAVYPKSTASVGAVVGAASASVREAGGCTALAAAAAKSAPSTTAAAAATLPNKSNGGRSSTTVRAGLPTTTFVGEANAAGVEGEGSPTTAGMRRKSNSSLSSKLVRRTSTTSEEFKYFSNPTADIKNTTTTTNNTADKNNNSNGKEVAVDKTSSAYLMSLTLAERRKQAQQKRRQHEKEEEEAKKPHLLRPVKQTMNIATHSSSPPMETPKASPARLPAAPNTATATPPSADALSQEISTIRTLMAGTILGLQNKTRRATNHHHQAVGSN